MAKINTMLISVFIILILGPTIGVAIKPTPIPDPAEQVQDARLTALETNGTLQQVNNSEQQGLINDLISDVSIIKSQILSLTDQISQLASRITNLETQVQPKIYGKYIEDGTIGTKLDGTDPNYPNNMTEIMNYTFYLPVDSSVYVESSGLLIQKEYNPDFYAIIEMNIDKDSSCMWYEVMRDGVYIHELQNSCGGIFRTYRGGVGDISFQISNVYSMNAGYHTVRLFGAAQTNIAKVKSASINIVSGPTGS